MVTEELIRGIKAEISPVTDNAEYEAREIVLSACEMSMTDLMLNRGKEISAEQANKAYEMACRRKDGEPLQYIVGTAGFMGMEFEVNPYTLIPRQDTETLVEALIERIGEGAEILDIGTGTGCIGISLAKYVKGARVTLLDISEGALETAKCNAERNGVKVRTIQADILSEIPEGKYDLIVSNPPYIESDVIKGLQREVKDFEPVSALDGGKDGLTFYRRITQIAVNMLNEEGILAYEIGFDQGQSVPELMGADFEGIEVIKDYCGNDRAVIGRLKK